MAFFSVNFILQKFCLCKKMTNMRYVFDSRSIYHHYSDANSFSFSESISNRVVGLPLDSTIWFVKLPIRIRVLIFRFVFDPDLWRGQCRIFFLRGSVKRVWFKCRILGITALWGYPNVNGSVKNFRQNTPTAPIFFLFNYFRENIWGAIWLQFYFLKYVCGTSWHRMHDT